MLKNELVLASIGVDTAEMWQSEVCPDMHTDPPSDNTYRSRHCLQNVGQDLGLEGNVEQQEAVEIALPDQSSNAEEHQEYLPKHALDIQDDLEHDRCNNI